MPLSNYQLFTQIKEQLRLHPEITDEEITEKLDLRGREPDLIRTARKDLEAG